MNFPRLTCCIWTATVTQQLFPSSVLVLSEKPLARAHSLAKKIFLLSISLSVPADLWSLGLQLLLWLPFQYVQTGSNFCTGAALFSSSSGPSPGCSCTVPSQPGNANTDSHQPLALTLLFKEQWCELWYTWANSSWKILLRRTSFGNACRKCYSSLSILPKLGAISLLSSHSWLNFNRRMGIG